MRVMMLSDMLEGEYDHQALPIQIRSMSDADIRYQISYNHLLGRVVCTCPDFQYRRINTGEDCKHLREWRKENGL